MMSPAGGVTSCKVEPHNLMAFYKYQQTNTLNPITGDYWNLELMEKLNEDDEDLHKNFDYINLERNYYDFTKPWNKQVHEGHLAIACFTSLERLLRSSDITAESFAETVAALKLEQEALKLKMHDPRPMITSVEEVIPKHQDFDPKVRIG